MSEEVDPTGGFGKTTIHLVDNRTLVIDEIRGDEIVNATFNAPICYISNGKCFTIPWSSVVFLSYNKERED